MPICFVIQPFDSGKYDKRFEDIYKPSILAAGLEPYRVDKDPGVSVPIEAIEKGIRQAAICLADITTDNPNVWYELGFAFAANRPVVMVCSEERTGKKYPFDIQHRTIIPYLADAPSDFDRLKENLTKRIKAIIESGDFIDRVSVADPMVKIEGLSQTEIIVLATIAGSIYVPSAEVPVFTVKNDAERAGITAMGFNLATRKLSNKHIVEIVTMYDERDGEPFQGLVITEQGWQWIEDNEGLFALIKPSESEGIDF